MGQGRCCATVMKIPLVLVLAPCVAALFDAVRLPDFPVQYEGYQRQCGIPVQCAGDFSCPNVRDWRFLERAAQSLAKAEFEQNELLANDKCYLIGEEEFDFEMFFTDALDGDGEISVKNTRTTEIFLQKLTQRGKCAVKNMLERRCRNTNQSLSLEQCDHRKLFKCNVNYPYRSYTGVCNNLQHATWGQVGNPLKSEMAPCYDDYVLKRRLSTSGRKLPSNRQLMQDVQRALNSIPEDEPSAGLFNMFGVFMCEFINADMLGRVMSRVRTETEGFRGCRADGRGVSRFKSPLTSPLRVFEDDPNYGPLNVECLNFSPIENANDFCEVAFSRKRNLATSYLDLSQVYGDGQYDRDGKLKTSFCQASEETVKLHVIALQFMINGGLYAQLHNYCVDRVTACGSVAVLEDVVEKCRALTIGVYQKIIYEELLPKLFGASFLAQCNLNCAYDPTLESVVSSTYIYGPGRFQHIWIPENLTYVQRGRADKVGLYKFFENFETFNCASALAGLLNDPIRTSGLSDSIMNIFYSKDGTRGHCLPCLDLERGRDAGVCPLLTYKHFADRVAGLDSSTCYDSFDDLSDMFDPELIEVLAAHYETPFDVDLLFSIFETVRPQGSFLPRMTATATCLEFKRLKCSDRFFYSWNPFLTPAAKELISTINLSTLLAMFGGIDPVPVKPLGINSKTVPAQSLRDVVESKAQLFCAL